MADNQDTGKQHSIDWGVFADQKAKTSLILADQTDRSVTIAEYWSSRLGIPLTVGAPEKHHENKRRNKIKTVGENKSEKYLFQLRVADGMLGLTLPELPHLKELLFDLESGPTLTRLKTIGQNDPLSKAVGGKAKIEQAGPTESGQRRLLDACFGQGLDSLLFLKLGYSVTATEWNPIIYSLIEDAIIRARLGRSAVSDLFKTSQFELICGQAIDPLKNSAKKFDVVYLDPMFANDPGKTSLPRKEIQVFRYLLQDHATKQMHSNVQYEKHSALPESGGNFDDKKRKYDHRQFLIGALQLARENHHAKVVIKQGHQGVGYQDLNLPKPTHIFSGKLSQYLVYNPST